MIKIDKQRQVGVANREIAIPLPSAVSCLLVEAFQDTYLDAMIENETERKRLDDEIMLRWFG